MADGDLGESDDELPFDRVGESASPVQQLDLWSRTYGHPPTTVDYDISESFRTTIPSADGGFLAIGTRRCNIDQFALGCHANGQYREPRIWAVKVKPDGSEMVWEKAYGGFKGTAALAAIPGKSTGPDPEDETYIIAGIDRFTGPGQSGNPRLKIMQIDYYGDVLVDKVFAPVANDEYEQVIPLRIIRGIDDEGNEDGWLIVGFAIVDEDSLGPDAAYKNRGFILKLDDDLEVEFFRAVDRGALDNSQDPLKRTSDEQFHAVTTLDNRYVVAGLSEVGEHVGDSSSVRPLIAVFKPDGELEQAVVLDEFEAPSPGCRGLFATDIVNDPNFGLHILLTDNYRLGTQNFSFDCTDPGFYVGRLDTDFTPQSLRRYWYDFPSTPSPLAPRIHGASEFDFLSNGQIAVTTSHNYLINEYGSILENDWSDTSVNLLDVGGNVVRQLDYGGYATHDTIRQFQQLPDGRCLLTGSTDLFETPSPYTSSAFDPMIGHNFTARQDGWLAMDNCDDPIAETTPEIATGPYPLQSGYFISLPGTDPSATFELSLLTEDVVATPKVIDLPVLDVPDNIVVPPTQWDWLLSPLYTWYPF